MTCARFIALLLTCLYLSLPVQVLGQAFQQSAPHTQDTLQTSPASTPSCPECPCHDTDHTDCNATCSCCSPLAPWPLHVACSYTPLERELVATDPFWTLPHVYHPIFVPPQNLS